MRAPCISAACAARAVCDCVASHKKAPTPPAVQDMAAYHQPLNPLNQRLIAHVARYAPCGFVELYAVFGDAPDDRLAQERFRARLNYLVYSARLRARGRCRTRTWLSAFVALSESASCTVPAPAASAPTPPRQHDAMHGPLYVPEAGPALREGSLDYQRYASFGDRC